MIRDHLLGYPPVLDATHPLPERTNPARKEPQTRAEIEERRFADWSCTRRYARKQGFSTDEKVLGCDAQHSKNALIKTPVPMLSGELKKLAEARERALRKHIEVAALVKTVYLPEDDRFAADMREQLDQLGVPRG